MRCILPIPQIRPGMSGMLEVNEHSNDQSTSLLTIQNWSNTTLPPLKHYNEVTLFHSLADASTYTHRLFHHFIANHWYRSDSLNPKVLPMVNGAAETARTPCVAIVIVGKPSWILLHVCDSKPFKRRS